MKIMKILLDLFEFANMQQLRLHTLIRPLTKDLIPFIKRGKQKVPYATYLPIVGGIRKDPIAALSKLKVDISVITERIENSIKLTGEEYYSEIYAVLVDKLDIQVAESTRRKLNIIYDLRSVYEANIHNIREDLLSVLIIVLIFIEMIVGIASYLSSKLSILIFVSSKPQLLMFMLGVTKEALRLALIGPLLIALSSLSAITNQNIQQYVECRAIAHSLLQGHTFQHIAHVSSPGPKPLPLFL